MRKPIIAGNWKMNKTPAEAAELVAALVPAVKDAACEVVVCVPAVCYGAVAEAAREATSAWARRTSTCQERRLHGRAERGHAQGLRSGIRDHRPQRAPPVLRRDGRDREPAREGRRGRRADSHRVRGRKEGRARKRLYRRDRPVPDAHGADRPFRRRGGERRNRLRTGVGHRHGADRDRRAGERDIGVIRKALAGRYGQAVPTRCASSTAAA